MATSEHLLLKRKTASEWEAETKVLWEGEPGYDKTHGALKIGDGSTQWRYLPYTPAIIDNLTSYRQDAVLSANMGRELDDKKLDANMIEDNLDSDRGDMALSARQGKALNNAKVNRADVVDDLTDVIEHDEYRERPLSAMQGKKLKEETPIVQNNLTTEDLEVTDPFSEDYNRPYALSARQGYELNERINNLPTTQNIRVATTEGWAADDPVLELGELGLNSTSNRLKCGDGVTAWSELPYITPRVLDTLNALNTDMALSANMGRELHATKVEKSAITSSVDDSSSSKVASALLASKKVNYTDIENPIITTLRSKALSDYTTKQAAGIRVVKNLLTELDKKASDSDLTELETRISTVQTTVEKVQSETWTFTLTSGGTVTKKVAIWSS